MGGLSGKFTKGAGGALPALELRFLGSEVGSAVSHLVRALGAQPLTRHRESALGGPS